MEIQILLNKLHDSQQEIVRTKRRFNILKCGRRFGKTELMIDIVCNAALDGFPCGYWSPTYKDLYEVWKEVKRVLDPVTKRKDEQVKQIELITGGKVDFWSLEEPDSGRGRKYKVAVVDEAEKAKKLKEALNGTIIATLADYMGELWVVSSPKFGKTYFKELYNEADSSDLWKRWRFTTYDNPHISRSEIEIQKSILPKPFFDCEFLALDVDVVSMPFAYNFVKEKHVTRTAHEGIPNTPIRFIQDFNVDPMANIACKMWFDKDGHHIRFLRETALFNSGTEEMIREIRRQYTEKDLSLCLWTGDATSRKRTAEQTIKNTKHLTSWVKIDQAFRLGKRLHTPSGNPPVSSTRELLNTMLAIHPDIQFDHTMTRTINELIYTEARGDGSIIQDNRSDEKQRGDFLDCVRYGFWTWCNDFEINMRKYGVK